MATPFRSRRRPATAGRAPALPKFVQQRNKVRLDPLVEGVGFEPTGPMRHNGCELVVPGEPQSLLTCTYICCDPQRSGRLYRNLSLRVVPRVIRQSTGQRSGWDLNPRWLAPHNISSVAPSASRTPLRRGGYQRPLRPWNRAGLGSGGPGRPSFGKEGGQEAC